MGDVGGRDRCLQTLEGTVICWPSDFGRKAQTSQRQRDVAVTRCIAEGRRYSKLLYATSARVNSKSRSNDELHATAVATDAATQRVWLGQTDRQTDRRADGHSRDVRATHFAYAITLLILPFEFRYYILYLVTGNNLIPLGLFPSPIDLFALITSSFCVHSPIIIYYSPNVSLPA